MDTKNMDEQWAILFQNAQNRNLIVNSHHKSTIGKWAWSSHIVGSENMSKMNPPTDPFTFEYNFNENLPYTYNILPLDSVVENLSKYAGPSKINLSPIGWLKTGYTVKKAINE